MEGMLQPEPEAPILGGPALSTRAHTRSEARERSSTEPPALLTGCAFRGVRERSSTGVQGVAAPLFGQPLHRLARAREGGRNGVPTAIMHVVRTIHARLDRQPLGGITAVATREASEPGMVRLQMELEASDNVDLEQFSVMQLFLAVDLWLGMLPSAVVSGALAEEFLAVWRSHDDVSAATLAARTLSAERRAILHVVLGLLRRLCADSPTELVRGGQDFVALLAPSLVGPASLDTAEAERLVNLWLDSTDELADTVSAAAAQLGTTDSDADDTPAFSVHLNFFLDPNSAAGPAHCWRVPVAQGVTQLGSAWANALGWARPSTCSARYICAMFVCRISM